jgi:CheY-like chemotaxis protein
LTQPCSILAVDDDRLVLEILAELLEALGHRVRAVSSAFDALEIIRAGDKFDLIVTDISMPVMSGIELVRAVRLIDPQLPVVFITGYTTKLTELTQLLDRRTKILGKPYAIEGLAKKIDCALG